MKKQKTLLSLQKIVLIIAMLTAGLAFNACNNDDPDPDPEISSVSYEGNTTNGFEGTVYGEHFTSDTSQITLTVTVGGEEYTATLTAACDTAVSFTLPEGVDLGSATVVLTIEGRSASATTTITLANDPFTVTDLDEEKGRAGDEIKIIGTNLYKDDFEVTINDVVQTITGDSDDEAGSWIKIELEERTFSGEVTITRNSDSLSVTLDDDFEYDETYVVDSISYSLTISPSPNDILISNGNILIAGNGGISVYSLEGGTSTDTLFIGESIKSIYKRSNEDLLIAKDDYYVFKDAGDDVFDTIVEYSVKTRPRMAEKDGSLYFSHMKDGKIYKIDNYNETPVEVASVQWVNQICYNAKDNLIANDQYGHIIYSIDVSTGTTTEIFNYDSLTSITLFQMYFAYYATSEKMYMAGGNSVQKLYTIDADNTIEEVDQDMLKGVTFGSYGMTIYNGVIYVLGDNDTIYTITIK